MQSRARRMARFVAIPALMATGVVFTVTGLASGEGRIAKRWTQKNGRLEVEEYELPTRAGPLRCEFPVYDFGTVWEGDEVFHTFNVANDSDNDVWVEMIRACFCLPPRQVFRIPARGTKRIPFCASTGGMRGRFTKSASIQLTTPPNYPVCSYCGIAKSRHAAQGWSWNRCVLPPWPTQWKIPGRALAGAVCSRLGL